MLILTYVVKLTLLSLNQSQGSWLVEGLEYWRSHAGLQKTDTTIAEK